MSCQKVGKGRNRWGSYEARNGRDGGCLALRPDKATDLSLLSLHHNGIRPESEKYNLFCDGNVFTKPYLSLLEICSDSISL